MADAPPGHVIDARMVEHAELAAVLAQPARVAEVVAVADLLVSTFRSGGRLLLFGNGGSAAVADHAAAEFVGRCTQDRPPLDAVALSEAGAVVTALANDYGFDAVFARQVGAHGRAGDCAIGMTTSGRSSNVVLGLREAGSRGLTTVALTGAEPGPAGEEAQIVLSVPALHTGRVQEAHLLWCHLWAEHVEACLFPSDVP